MTDNLNVELKPLPVWQPGVYRHTGNQKLYFVLGRADNRTHKNNNDTDTRLIYIALYTSEDRQFLHRRTVENFTELVGLHTRRFTFVPREVWFLELEPRFHALVLALNAAYFSEGLV